jgi:phosphate transport system protein
MSRLLDRGLEQLTTILLRMGDMAEKTIRIAVTGFMNGTDVNDEIRDFSEALLAMTVSVEDKAFELMVKYQPVASDLRIINSYMKIAYDFERYGRYALDITLTQQRFGTSQKCAYSRDLMEKMAEKAVLMVHTSVDALRSNDGEMAKSLATTENEVDAMYSDYLEKLSKAPPSTKCIVSTALVVKYLERIADHATYVGESIYYVATGQKILLR